MYKYEDMRPNLFLEENQKAFLDVRDCAARLLSEAGAFTMEAVISKFTGSNWFLMSCVDRLVELGEIHEIINPGVAGQHRAFIR